MFVPLNLAWRWKATIILSYSYGVRFAADCSVWELFTLGLFTARSYTPNSILLSVNGIRWFTIVKITFWRGS